MGEERHLLSPHARSHSSQSKAKPKHEETLPAVHNQPAHSPSAHGGSMTPQFRGLHTPPPPYRLGTNIPRTCLGWLKAHGGRDGVSAGLCGIS